MSLTMSHISSAIHIHPQNNRIFEFRDRPYMLVCATEHYGAVINRPFQFEKYLADAAAKKQTLTRLFMLFREQQSPQNPYSTCKPESPDFVTPFMRTGPGKALDGQPKYDLDRWNPEFFERLHRFLALASDYGIIVEVTLLSNTYAPEVWALNPLHADNHIGGGGKVEWFEYNTQRHPELFERQKAHVRKIVEETHRYDNIIYEICNEPGGGFGGGAPHPSPAEVDEWQMAIAEVIRETEDRLGSRHLIAGQEAFTYEPWQQSSDKSFAEFGIDIVNMHPLPNTTYDGQSYHMGEFMAKQLKLKDVRDYCLATRNERKPLNYDEDNSSTQYKDPEGWTIHRKRAWTTLLCGCHYDMIDFSINNYLETGTPESQRHIRTWMMFLSEFIHSVDLARARPVVAFLAEQPQHTVESVLAAGSEDYCIYLADGRELAEEGAGSPIHGHIVFDLSEGDYLASFYSPVSGLYSPSVSVQGGSGIKLALPSFTDDAVIRIKKANQ